METPKLHVRRPAEGPIRLSICIPQYERRAHLMHCLSAIANAGFDGVQVCISDGSPRDYDEQPLVDCIDGLGLPYEYRRWVGVTPYDANLRSAISLAEGEACVLMGNDDEIEEGALDLLWDTYQRHDRPVIIPDFRDFGTSTRAKRVRTTRAVGSGPAAAMRHYRDFSFVSGIVLPRAEAHALATDRWDGSEMYQTYLGCRMVSQGTTLVHLANPVVVKDVHIPGHAVESFQTRPRQSRWDFSPRLKPVRRLPAVVFDAVEPALASGERQRAIRLIFSQLILLTYPYWLVTYRGVQSWAYAVGLARGMRPGLMLQGVPANLATRGYLATLHAAATLAGLFVPRRLFFAMQASMYRLAKIVFAHRADD